MLKQRMASAQAQSVESAVTELTEWILGVAVAGFGHLWKAVADASWSIGRYYDLHILHLHVGQMDTAQCIYCLLCNGITFIILLHWFIHCQGTLQWRAEKCHDVSSFFPKSTLFTFLGFWRSKWNARTSWMIELTIINAPLHWQKNRNIFKAKS